MQEKYDKVPEKVIREKMQQKLPTTIVSGLIGGVEFSVANTGQTFYLKATGKLDC